MTARVATALAALGLIAAANASTGDYRPAPDAPLDVEIYDRTNGQLLPLHRHRGEVYVAGEPGHEYEIRLRRRGPGRVLAVTSVDGVNVVTGETAATNQAGYVLDGWSATAIDGWRKSLDEVAAFYFTRLRNSYAARTGRPAHVGVIGVAMFRERERVEPLEHAWRGAAPPVAASPAAAADANAAAESASASGERRADSGAARQRLGTGHGGRRDSRVTHTRFERRSETPDAVLRIYYDSHERLVARGIITEPPRYYGARPQPFPAGFVPDP